MAPLHPFEASLAGSWNPKDWRELDVLVAVSGGADSVALLRAMVALHKDGPGQILVAHLNHRLRGPQSDADEAFVVDLCDRLQVPCHVAHAPVASLAETTSDGLEAAARQARYDFLRQTANQLGARYVVTAHTADDQIETILHHIVRGTGIAGLSGMARTRPLGEAATLIRPLLEFRRAELIAYLRDLGQPYCTDQSNDDPRFTRNRIRRQLLPLLAERFNPSVDDALLRLGLLAGEVQKVIGTLVADLAQRHVLQEGPTAIRVKTAGLQTQPPYLVRELLIAAWRNQGWPMQAMGFAQWDLLASMVFDPAPSPAKQTFPGAVTAQRRRDELILTAPTT